jgi:hypothetical protein
MAASEDVTAPVERRRYARYPVALAVRVGASSGARFGTMYDISVGGAFVALDPAVPVHSALTITILLHDHSELVLDGEVRHASSAPGASADRVSGIGVEFRLADPKARRRLVSLVERVRQSQDPRA